MPTTKVVFEPQDNGDFWEKHYRHDDDPDVAPVEVARFYAAARQAHREDDGWYLRDHEGNPVKFTGEYGGRHYVKGHAPHVPTRDQVLGAIRQLGAECAVWRALEAEAVAEGDKAGQMFAHLSARAAYAQAREWMNQVEDAPGEAR